MKTALYITSTSEAQIVLTPETELEKKLMEGIFPENDLAQTVGLPNIKASVKMFRGSFYECAGGFVRQGKDDSSIMLVIDGMAKA
jgi:hypothetical protein